MPKKQALKQVGKAGLKSAAAGVAREIRPSILATFGKAKKRQFSQLDFVTALKCSQAYANKSLRKLLGNGNISREMVGNKYLYTFKKSA